MVLKKQFNGFHKMLKIDLDDISQYSNLPSILNDKTLKVKYKNHQSNIREFEMDKWKSLLSLCESSDTKIGEYRDLNDEGLRIIFKSFFKTFFI